ncbi:MAG: hypothetical protein IJ856_02860 [Candidatus Methanomethylophilaceae archaeon]|nr:hypothetical protein [Candidatus Methanomethylophilaceae archaeon]
MTSVVKVEMRVCDRRCRIEATHRDDGIGLRIESDCNKVQLMGDKLAEGVALEDVLDIYSSRISSPEVRGNVCFECLAVPAIFNACWLEEGMISKNLARKAGSNSVEFDEARGHSSSSSSKTLSDE